MPVHGVLRCKVWLLERRPCAGVTSGVGRATISWIELGAKISLSGVPGTVAPNVPPSHPPRLSRVSRTLNTPSLLWVWPLPLGTSSGFIVPVGTPLTPFCSYRASCHADVSYLLIWPPADRPEAVPWSGCSEQSSGASRTTSPDGAGVSCTNVAVRVRSPCPLGSVGGVHGPGRGYKAPALPPGW